MLDVPEHVLKAVVVIVNQDVIPIVWLIMVPHRHRVQVYVQVGVLAVLLAVMDALDVKVHVAVVTADHNVLVVVLLDVKLDVQDVLVIVMHAPVVLDVWADVPPDVMGARVHV